MKLLRGVAFFVSTLALYLGVPLLGWGIGDLRGFLALPPRLWYALFITAFGLAVGYQAIDAPEGIRGRRGEEGKLVPRQHMVRVVVSLALYAVLFFLPFADRRAIGVMGDSQPARWAGVFLVGLGCALVFWSGVALGRLYSAEVTIQKNHQLVTSGPYRYIRHPRYLGAIVLVFGLSFVFRSWIGLVAGILFLGVMWFRIRDEEALMHQEFGQEWETYCKRSWRLIPFLY